MVVVVVVVAAAAVAVVVMVRQAASPVAAAPPQPPPVPSAVESAMIRMMQPDTAVVRAAEVELKAYLRNPATVPVFLQLMGASANLHVREGKQRALWGLASWSPPVFPALPLLQLYGRMWCSEDDCVQAVGDGGRWAAGAGVCRRGHGGLA